MSGNTNTPYKARGSAEPFVAMLAKVFKALVVVIVVAFWSLSAVGLTNGFLILKRRRHRLCIALSAIQILGTPFHIALGIVSVFMLNNDEARSLFANGRDK